MTISMIIHVNTEVLTTGLVIKEGLKFDGRLSQSSRSLLLKIILFGVGDLLWIICFPQMKLMWKQ